MDAASKALSYRQDIIEENIRLTYALQVVLRFSFLIFSYLVDVDFVFVNSTILSTKPSVILIIPSPPSPPKKKTFCRSVFSNSYVNLMLQMVLGKQIRLLVIFPDFFII